MRALDIQVGKTAAKKLGQEGWQPELFDTLLGASGGPKWLVLKAMDSVLHKRLLATRNTPIDLIGSSIGTWRHACLTQEDALGALNRFEQAYIAQAYSERPSPREVSQVASEILDEALGTEGLTALVEHRAMRNHIVTARGMGIASGSSRALVASGMGLAALGNAVSRRFLDTCFHRVVFSQPGAVLPEWLAGTPTDQATLSTGNAASALKASGAIPLVLEPERDIAGAPAGNYWDGGIIDYHFSLPARTGEGLILYPHFAGTLTSGWFDKFLPWRRQRRPICDDLVLLSPSPDWVAALPHGKIPDRRDFERMTNEDRQKYWRICVSAGEALAEELEHVLDGRDPLARATLL